MGKRGPAPKPTTLRILHGDRADRINTAEPVPPTEDIACPEWASDAWDIDAFLVVCEALARYKAATQLVNGSALLVQGGSGLMKNPALQVQAEAERTFLQFAARFGLTPSDRQGIKTEVADGATGGAERLLS
jgi:P27 family predicted phage terminase small subunit